MLTIHFDEEDLVDKDNNFQLIGMREADFRAVVAGAGWQPRRVDSFYYKGEILLSPNEGDYVVPRTYEESAYWWGRIADANAFMELFEDDIEASAMQEDEEEGE